MTAAPSEDAELSPSLQTAAARFFAALERLEGSVADRLARELTRADLEEELAVTQDDRSRLAQELDSALTRAAAVEKTRDEVLRRVERASAGVAAVLNLPPALDGEA
ncbi:MAG TPA: DUF4164 family protein [Methylocystis sp.]|nr:DUF4164 family protein [Methylocystis sp.]